jgi:hypothetical protein
MDTTTLLIIVILLVVVGGGGWYGRGRWYKPSLERHGKSIRRARVRRGSDAGSGASSTRGQLTIGRVGVKVLATRRAGPTS